MDDSVYVKCDETQIKKADRMNCQPINMSLIRKSVHGLPEQLQ